MRLLFILLLAFFSNVVFAQQNPPAITFNHLYGGSELDASASIVFANNEYYFIGATGSSDGDATGNHGYGDVWLVKTDSAGNSKWSECYGGTRDENLNRGCAKLTYDGGIIIAASTKSTNGDVTGIHDSLSADFWLVKIDTSGNIQWQKTLGGSLEERPSALIQTTDSGFVIIGHTNSNDYDVNGLHAVVGNLFDAWIIKLSKVGNLEWQKCIGGSQNDFGEAIVPTNDGNYIIVGRTRSSDSDIVGNHSSTTMEDVFLIKISSSDGSVIWSKCFGGTGADQFGSLLANPDGSMVLGMVNGTTDGDFVNFPNVYDYCLFKLDSSGNVVWSKHYGGSKVDLITDIITCMEGGYLLCGTSRSDDGDVTIHYGGPVNDIWLLKVDENGQKQWQKTLGGSDLEAGPKVMQVVDSGYVITSYTKSNDYDLPSATNNGSYDMWALKIGGKTTSIKNLYTNSILRVFPTLSKGQTTIEFAKPMKGVRIRALNTEGREVNIRTSKTSETTYIVDNLADGLNLLYVSSNEGTQAFKIVVSQ